MAATVHRIVRSASTPISPPSGSACVIDYAWSSGILSAYQVSTLLVDHHENALGLVIDRLLVVSLRRAIYPRGRNDRIILVPEQYWHRKQNSRSETKFLVNHGMINHFDLHG